MGIDDLQRQIKEDEATDALELASKLPVGEYAKARGIAPQIVHYYIRRGQIEKEKCICGRPVIDVKATNALFDDIEKKKSKVNTEEDNDVHS